MNAVLSACLFAAGLLLSGCDAVFTQQPMGTDVVKLDIPTWQGTWLGDEIVMVTTVLDSDKGMMQAAWVERGPEGARFETSNGTIRQSGDRLFLTMEHQLPKDKGSGDARTSPEVEAVPPEYYWARVENDGKRVVLWWPDVDQFRLAVSEGRLPGTIKEDKDVVLGELDDAQMDLVNTPAGNLLRWSDPVVFIRIGD